MPLRVKNGVIIPVAPSATSELLAGFMKDTAILPDGSLLAPSPTERPLDIPWFQQRKELWCWVACAQMVLRFFGTFLKQCDIARRQLGKPCCDAFTPSYCDQACNAEQITQAFRRVGIDSEPDDKVASFFRIQDEVTGNNPRPVVAGVTWSGGGGHLVVISGARNVNNIRYVRVHDPIYGPGDIRYSDLKDSYGPNDNGKWTHTWMNFRLE
jgi:hypothetical protein